MDLPKRLREHDYEWCPQDAKALGAEAADEIERLREAFQGLLRVADGVPMSGIEAERLTTAARSALQQKESE